MRRSEWFLHGGRLLLLALLAWKAAVVSGGIAETMLSGPLRVPAAARPAERLTPVLADGDLERLFPPPPVLPPADTTPPPPPVIDWRLVGTAVGNASHPYCVLEHPTTHRQATYRLGARADDDSVVSSIESGRVTLRRDGHARVLDLRLP